MALEYGTGGNISVQMAGPFGAGGGSSAKLTEIVLPAANWKGAASPYSQVVTVDNVSVNSKVDLQPSVEQLEIFHDKDIAFSTENDGGVVTVYAVGDRPTNDYTIQATIMEVVA
jgi:hypothetical protein